MQARADGLRPELLKVREAADRLRLSERTVWALIATGRLTPYRLGRRATRVDAAEVERLIDAARAAAAP